MFCHETIHECIDVNINKKNIYVDKNIASLICELNKVGLKTMASCEGKLQSKSIFDFAYVSIKMDNAYFTYDFKDNVLCINWNSDIESKINIPKSRMVNKYVLC